MTLDCRHCGGPCNVPEWALDSSYFPNDIFGYQAYVLRVHDWIKPGRLAEVEQVRAEIRAMVLPPSFPCVVCKRHAFDRDGISCYWCGGPNARVADPETEVAQ